MEDDAYLVEGEFIFTSYDPPKLLVGMRFLTSLTLGVLEPEHLLFTLDEIPEDEDLFKEVNGAPVTFNIITTGSDGEIIALDNEIGMFDDGNGHLRSITDHEINVILNKYDATMNIESDETGDPILYDGKVIISYLSESGEEAN